jgi:probable HAF family extracellular repeat protein
MYTQSYSMSHAQRSICFVFSSFNGDSSMFTKRLNYAFATYLLLSVSPAHGTISYTLTDLGTLGGSESRAYGINASGQVVGSSVVSNNIVTHAFLYSGGDLVDLNTLIDPGLGWTLHTANGINDNGQIVGQGFIGGVSFRAFLLTPITPVPVPAAVWLFGSALAGMGVISRRKLA